MCKRINHFNTLVVFCVKIELEDIIDINRAEEAVNATLYGLLGGWYLFFYAMRFEIAFVFGTDAEKIEAEGIDETMRQLRLSLFGGEHYDEDGNQMLLDIEDWMAEAEPGEIYKRHGGFYVRRKE